MMCAGVCAAGELLVTVRRAQVRRPLWLASVYSALLGLVLYRYGMCGQMSDAVGCGNR